MSSVAAHFLDDNQADRLDGTLVTYNPVTSGSLPTVSLSSGTAAQVVATRDATLALALTFDASAADATAKIELSPDNSTFSTLATCKIPNATNPSNGEVWLVTVPVPAGWYVKVTVSHVTITSATYY